MLKEEKRMNHLVKIKNSIRISVFLLIVIVSCGISTSEAGGSWFQVERLRLVDDLVQKLIQSKMCVDKNDCVKKQLIFAAGEPWGLDVSVYGINDGRVLTELVNSCSDMFFSSGRKMNIKVKVTHITKSEDMATPFWKKDKAIEITFKGEE